MRKILIGTIILLLIVMAFVVIFKGISIGNFNILSVEQITKENEKLSKEILETEILENNVYKSKIEELDKNSLSLQTAKQEYLDLANISSEKDITKAGQQEIYTLEFLWTRLGRHATAQGVILKYEITSGTTGETDVKNIKFSVTGNYISIINFISVLEEDEDLLFRIENFKIIPSGEFKQATFITKNVRIKSENVTDTNKNIQEKTENSTEQDNTSKP